jgi:hypothetical protein
MHRLLLQGLLSLTVVALAACASTHIQLGDDWDDDQIEATSPDAFAERWGEPDETKNEKVGGELQTTAIWYCLDGQYREMVWRLRRREDGRPYWFLASDVTKEGDCP